MIKVEAYRCEECEGNRVTSTLPKPKDMTKLTNELITYGNSLVTCDNCKGTGIVWLTKKEAENEV